MSGLDTEVRSFIAELSKLTDAQTLAGSFAALISKFKCRFFVVSGIPDYATSLQDLIVIHNLPQDWVAEYLDNNYIEKDPIARHCIESKDPFFWREATGASATPEAAQIMTRAERYGLTHGVCFPIHNINGFEAGVSLSGFPAPPMRTEVRSLYLASIMTFNALRRIKADHSLRIAEVSEREQEVLTWCALGKTSKEIAYILFVSENTVNAHIKSATHKLSANNKTEAITIAIRKGIINI